MRPVGNQNTADIYALGFNVMNFLQNNAWVNDYTVTQETGFAMNDNFWPMLLAQFGLFGAFLYGYWLVAQLGYCLKKTPPGQPRAGALGLIAFFLISSAGNPIFTSASGVFLAIALGLTSDFFAKVTRKIERRKIERR